jgi:chorismate--pyruvate lyase
VHDTTLALAAGESVSPFAASVARSIFMAARPGLTDGKTGCLKWRKFSSEQLALGMAQHQLALVREVVLYGNNQPWVFARSLLPVTSLTGPLRHLRKQGNRPLGALLFSLPRLQRSAMMVACITPQHEYVPAEFLGDGPVWGRRSVFSIDGRALLVSEVFLDNLTRVLNLPHTPESTQ